MTIINIVRFGKKDLPLMLIYSLYSYYSYQTRLTSQNTPIYLHSNIHTYIHLPTTNFVVGIYTQSHTVKQRNTFI